MRFPLLAALALALTLAQPASALSCLRPTVASSFGHAQDSPLTYVLATGRLTPLPGTAAPVPRDPPLPVSEVRRARFDGQFASPDGFDRPASIPVTVELICVGPWCGDVPQGDQIFFLERHGDAHVLLEGPCPRYALPATSDALNVALACLNGDCPTD